MSLQVKDYPRDLYDAHFEIVMDGDKWTVRFYANQGGDKITEQSGVGGLAAAHAFVKKGMVEFAKEGV
jgi:hypothetical protein